MQSFESLLAAQPNVAPSFAAAFAITVVCPYCKGHNAACTNCASHGYIVEERHD
jgi:hypothetical protein